MARKCKSFRFFMRIKPFVLQTYWCFSSIRVPIDTFLLVKSYLTAKQCLYLPAADTSLAKLPKYWLLLWIVLIFNLGLFKSNCLDFFHRGLNQQLCFRTRWFKFHIFIFHRFLEFLISLFCQSYVYVWHFFVLELFFSTATGCIFYSRLQSTNFEFSTVLKWVTLIFNALSGNLIGWEFQNLHMHVNLLEISTHLPQKLPTGLLPSRCEWTVLSLYTVAR